MRYLRTFALAIGGLLLLASLAAFLLPATTAVERSADVSGTDYDVSAVVSDLRQWPSWSPWLRKDPSAAITFDTTSTGTAVALHWHGSNGESGTIRHIATDPRRAATFSIAFDDFSPMLLTITMHGSATTTRTAIHLVADASYNPVARWFGLFLPDMVTPDFGRALRGIDSIVRLRRRGRLTAAVERDVPSQTGLGIRSTIARAELGSFLAQSYAELHRHCGRANIASNHPPVAIVHRMAEDSIDLTAALFLLHRGRGLGHIRPVTIPAGRILESSFFGPFESIFDAASELARSRGGDSSQASHDVWFAFITDPQSTNDSRQWQTIIRMAQR
ncbi:MAG: SRPBCC family protein [Candidatus Kapabacteria bacterium]|jgi:effector-binding domain-containing protein|nr:SRPBCC family protein [Candidatus Kapabacteria bacterium]